MGRKQTPQPLDIPSGDGSGAGSSSSDPCGAFDGNDKIRVDEAPRSAPLSLISPILPRSPFRFSTKVAQGGYGGQPSVHSADCRHQEPSRNLPLSPATPSQSHLTLQRPFGFGRREDPLRGHDRDRPSTSPVKGGFFSNYKASKSSGRLQSVDLIRQVAPEDMSRDGDQPELTGMEEADDGKMNDRVSDKADKAEKAPSKNPLSGTLSIPSNPDVSSTISPDAAFTNSPQLLSATTPATPTNRKGKPKPFGLLSRTKSVKTDKGQHPSGEITPVIIQEPDRANTFSGLRTAPLRPDHDRSFRDIMGSVRNRSADRQRSSSRDMAGSREHGRSQMSLSGSFRENGGQGFLNNLRSSSSKAMNISKGLFNKVGRSGSSTAVVEKESSIDDEHYTLKVINLPLIEQTRLTRISKRLEDSRDKTEFWMPAFPWRAIDYLNYKGSETEGLYRVPGSGPQIKKWQRRFDEELDIDLFEQEDLYDINIVGSMLKAWLRELPDELFPKASQDKIARECAGAEQVPQLLIDELSNLRPYNYYLLFAITCHLSLLLAHSDKNKMDFRNLCICFQPCMRIDAFCFKFLVVDWRECWKGCKTENEWITTEYALWDLLPPSSGEGRSSTAIESCDERNVSSSDSSEPCSVNLENAPAVSNSKQPSKSKPLPVSESHSKSLSSEESSAALSVTETQPSRDIGAMKLAPITPLSPMILP